MKKPVLYVEHLPTDKKRLAFDFCYSAKMGAEQMDHTVKVFEDSDEVPGDPTNILVGSVEQLSKWLDKNGFGTPNAIAPDIFQPFLGREIAYMDMEIFQQYAIDAHQKGEYEPIFIKPASKIKAFTGFVVDDPKYIPVWSYNYTGLIQLQPVVDIVSEYRVYITNNKIVGMKHYSGDFFKYPDPRIVYQCKQIGDGLDYHSYILDFGITTDNETFLIEPNDGWAIGNYGLDAEKYYLLIRNRWLQLTGIRKKMDYVF